MQNLLNFTLQSIFYVYGSLGLILSIKCLLESNNNSSIFFISSILCFIIGYFLNLLFYNNDLKVKNFIITIFLSWLLLIIVSSIPFYSLIKVLDLNSIIFISTSYITTTGFNLEIFSHFQEYESLLIWSSFIQLIGGFFSIICFILFFLVLYNKHDKLVIFNKKLILRFFLYYFLFFIIYIFVLNFALKDFLNSFMVASAIISSGGTVGSNGHLLGFYFSDNNFLVVYSLLILLTILILPFFLYIHNSRIFKTYYLKILKRSFFIILILIFLFLLFINNSLLTLQENLFIFLSFLTTTGLLPNKVTNIMIIQQLYPLFFIFLILIMIGSFSGGSSGGLKIDRISILFIKIKDELTKLTLRHKVYGIDLVKKGANQKELNSFYALISLGIFIIILSMLLLCISGNSIFESFVFSIAALTNTGDGFLHINNVTLKENSNLFLILNFLMICGRFELIGYLLIFKKLSIKN